MTYGLLFLLIILAYFYFYLSSRQYLRREGFVSGAPLDQAFLGRDNMLEVSWPGGVVSPAPFDRIQKMRQTYGM